MREVWIERNTAAWQGSIEQAVAQVEAFRGSLEHRVIARFDDAVSAGDLGGMSECARIMAEFRQGESQLVQVLSEAPFLFHLHSTAEMLCCQAISACMVTPVTGVPSCGAASTCVPTKHFGQLCAS